MYTVLQVNITYAKHHSYAAKFRNPEKGLRKKERATQPNSKRLPKRTKACVIEQQGSSTNHYKLAFPHGLVCLQLFCTWHKHIVSMTRAFTKGQIAIPTKTKPCIHKISVLHIEEYLFRIYWIAVLKGDCVRHYGQQGSVWKSFCMLWKQCIMHSSNCMQKIRIHTALIYRVSQDPWATFFFFLTK